jgi:two-component system, chemotaxis family, chemotaxis protein CheY
MAKILIVDDSNLSRRTLRSILEPAGHLVVEANDGMIALEQYFLEKPDLVLLDLMMIGMGGMEVLERLREMDNKVRIIIATADIQNSTQEMAKTAGASGFVNKPFSSDRLLSAVNTVLKEGQDDTERASK